MARALGLDLGGTQVRAALIEDDGTIIARAAARTDLAGPRAVMAQFDALVAQVRDETGDLPFDGVGMCAPGPLDTDTGVSLGLPTLPHWTDFPLGDALRERFSVPVALENDAISAAFGEWKLGAGHGLRHLVYVTVSTGVGGGVVVDGRLMHGRRGMGSHIGHMIVQEGGPVCGCGAPGCLEAMAAGPAFAREGAAAAAAHPESLLARMEGPIGPAEIVEAARAGDAVAQGVVEREAYWLGVGFTSLLHLYSPEVIIMGGGVSQAYDELAPTIHATIARLAMPPFRDVRVVRAGLGVNSGLIGAAMLSLDR